MTSFQTCEWPRVPSTARPHRVEALWVQEEPAQSTVLSDPPAAEGRRPLGFAGEWVSALSPVTNGSGPV